MTRLGELLLQLAIGSHQQGSGVAGGQRAVLDLALHAWRELKQAQRIGNRRSALSDPLSDLIVGEVEVLDELLVGRRLVQGVEILAVQVLYQCLFQAGDVIRPR